QPEGGGHNRRSRGLPKGSAAHARPSRRRRRSLTFARGGLDRLAFELPTSSRGAPVALLDCIFTGFAWSGPFIFLPYNNGGLYLGRPPCLSFFPVYLSPLSGENFCSTQSRVTSQPTQYRIR